MWLGHSVHRGTVAAAAILIDCRLHHESEARRRVLRIWRTGDQVFRVAPGYLVRFHQAQWVDCHAAPGLVLTRSGKALVAFPADMSQLADLPAETVVIRDQGQTVQLTLGEAVNPSDWLDVQDWRPVATSSLGELPAPAAVVLQPPPAEVRQILPGIPQPNPKLTEVIATLQRARKNESQPSKRTSWIDNRLERWLGWATNLLKPAPAQGTAIQPNPPKWLTQKLRRWIKTAILRSGLAILYGRRQAEYLDRMMRLFEDGRLDEALRHAIPLEPGVITSAEEVFLGTPQARRTLQFGAGVASSSRLLLPEALMGEIQQLYRSAHVRLVREGKITEAAFVLAELLGEAEAAVALLERHGHIRLAAELAEARQLDPGLVIRLWWQAGDDQRAVQIAKRQNAYADAVHWLERHDRLAAGKLRFVWANALAACGDYLMATDVLWPVASARMLAADWIKQALDAGGEVTGRALARYLSLLPEDAERVMPQVRNLLDDEAPETLAARLSFADEIERAPASSITNGVRRAAARMLIREVAHGPTIASVEQLKRLLKQPGLQVLRSDLPPLPTSSRELKEPVVWRIAAGDRGTVRIWDLAYLPTGLTLVALGEQGIQLINHRGMTVTSFNQPAHHLVVSDNGSYAIAVADRGRIKRLARLNLLERRAQYWCEAELELFAPDFDGQRWFVASRGDVLLLDVTSPNVEALWRIPDVGNVTSIVRTPKELAFTCAAAQAVEHYYYTIRTLRLASRTLIRNREEQITYAASAANGLSRIIFDLSGQDYPLRLTEWPDDFSLGREQPIFERYAARKATTLGSQPMSRHPLEWAAAGFLERDQARLVVNGTACAVALRDKDAMQIEAYGTSKQLLTWLQLEKTRQLALRWQERFLSLGDEHGRILVFDTASRQVLRDIRR